MSGGNKKHKNKEIKEFRFYSWFYVCIECLPTVVFSSRLLSSSTKNQRVGAKQVRVPIALTFMMLFFFPNISPRGCFLKIDLFTLATNNLLRVKMNWVMLETLES